MKSKTIALAALLALASSLALAVGPALASAPNPVSTYLNFNPATTTKVKGQLVLSVTLTAVDGKPMGNRPVDFYQMVSLLGSREAHLGTAMTDSTGVATLAYQPAQRGQQTVRARFAGGDGFAKAEGDSVVSAKEVVAPFSPEPLPFGLVGRWLPYGIGILVLGTWVALLVVLVGTVVGIRAAVRAPAPVEPAAAPVLAARSRAGGAR